MEQLLHDGLVRDSSCTGLESWREVRKPQPHITRISRLLGEDHVGGTIYGIVNWIVCVPGLVSFAHIVFTQKLFRPYMPLLVKLYFLSSAVIQLVMTCRSSIAFSVGQIQDVGLIFLAGMVRNIVAWGQSDGLSDDEMMATSLWQCATSTFVVGIVLLVIGKLQWGQYVQMIPLPVVGGYLGYIGYFCAAAGLSIGSGKQINGPDTLVQLLDPSLQGKLLLLAVMTCAMLLVHFKVQHFLGMPAVLVALPVAFFAGLSALGFSVQDARANGFLPSSDLPPVSGTAVFDLFDTSMVEWWFLPRQALNLLGLSVIVSFGSSLDVAAIQAEMSGEKIDYDGELMTIGYGNLASGMCGGATGSYIFSQTIFSAKRGVRSRLNGIIVGVGELVLFFLPIDILEVLPNSYVGAIMCLFGFDIMLDWLWHSRRLMARTEYALVWVSFTCTMWLTSTNVFGVIEGMAVGTMAASMVFVLQYKDARDNWQVMLGRSSVVRPPCERRVLDTTYKSIFAVSLNGFAFFGASLNMAKSIEEEAERRAARFVCLDLGRISGMDSTATDQIRLLVLALERMGAIVLLSSLRSKTTQRLLKAHGVIGDGVDRLVFATLDQALQYCEEELLHKQHSPSKSKTPLEQPLEQLLLDYVDGFARDRTLIDAHVEAAEKLKRYFKRLVLPADRVLFEQEQPADAIFIIAAGACRVSSHMDWATQLSSAMLPSPPPDAVSMARSLDQDAEYGVHRRHVRSSRRTGSKQAGNGHASAEDPWQGGGGWGRLVSDDTEERVGVGAVLGDVGFYSRRTFGCDAVSDADGCVAYCITRKTMEQLEVSEPALLVFLQKVLLRDISQLLVQFLGPLQLAGGLS